MLIPKLIHRPKINQFEKIITTFVKPSAEGDPAEEKVFRIA